MNIWDQFKSSKIKKKQLKNPYFKRILKKNII